MKVLKGRHNEKRKIIKKIEGEQKGKEEINNRRNEWKGTNTKKTKRSESQQKIVLSLCSYYLLS